MSYNNSSKHFDYPLCNDETIDVSWVPAGLADFFAVFGNILAFILLWSNRKNHQWRSFYVLFAFLSVLDCLGVIVLFPFAMKRYASNFEWCFTTSICQLTSVLLVGAHLTSGMIICAMSYCRYKNLGLDIEQQCRTFEKKYFILGVTIIVVAYSISFIQLQSSSSTALMYPGTWCYFNFVNPSGVDQAISFIYSILGIFFVASTTVLNVFTTRRVVRDPTQKTILAERQAVSGFYDVHVIVFLVAVTVVSIIFWIPFLVVVLLHATHALSTNEAEELWSVRLVFWNAALDPWLYIILRSESILRIRSCFLSLWNFCRRREENEDEGLL
ncbi:prostaglandin E2 receptor EP4 subtype-like [Saccostrea cucullata]|uniref:prostaglandin E2 receptor EP4 subtype-like n=1 Tax=Saccostrea cuccullata TaxID=36930 RepID=UPI002ED193C7